MDNYKVYFYVIIFVIWLFNQIRKSGKSKPVVQEASEPTRQVPQTTKSPTPLLSPQKSAKGFMEKQTAKKSNRDDFFVELDRNSKEIRKSKKPKSLTSKNENVTYEESILDEEESIRLKVQKDQLDALNNRKQRVALSDEHLEPYSLQDNSSRNKYEEMLKNPQDLRTAVILSEILNRKY